MYVYGSESTNTPGFVIKNGVTYKIIHDPGTESIRYVVNVADGVIAQEIDYDEFGNIVLNTDPSFQPLGFAGGLYDADTKLVRFGARDYDPVVSRWMSKDPIDFAGGDTNLYAYVGGNPMSYVDPTGLKVGDWWDLLANFNRSKEIAAEELAKRPRAHNDMGDAMRHFEWMRRTTEETNQFTAFTVGWGHEIQSLFSRGRMPIMQYLKESWMDVHNNSLGRQYGSRKENACPINLTTVPGTGGYNE